MTVPGGKKTRRGPRGGAKKKIAVTVDANRDNAFIESAGDAGTTTRVLPHEVRKRIYRLVLLSANCKVDRKVKEWDTNGWGHTYRFQINLLRANRAMYAEAKQVLYHENIFVLVYAKEHYFDTSLKIYGVPIASRHFTALQRFTEHPLELTFETHGHTTVCTCETCSQPRRESLHLMLADDLPALTRCMRISNHLTVHQTFNLIKSTRDKPLSFIPPATTQEHCSTKIVFRETSSGKPALSMIDEVLGHLQKVVGSRKVMFSGFIDSKVAAQTERVMMPKVVWGYAMGWDLVELSREMKREGDQLARISGINPNDADRWMRNVYGAIAEHSGNSFIYRQLKGYRDYRTWSNRLCQDWTESWTLLNYDLAVTLTLLNLLPGRYDDARAFSNDARRFGGQACHMSAESMARRLHIEAFLALEQGGCQEVLDKLKAARTIRETSGLSRDPALDGDYEKHLKHTVTGLPQFKLCLCCSSFSGSTCETLNSDFPGAVPDGLVGWQDTHHQLTPAQIKSMGARLDGVPPRIEVNDEVPVCHLRGAATDGEEDDDDGSDDDDEDDYLFGTTDLMSFLPTMSDGPPRLVPYTMARPPAVMARAHIARASEADDNAGGNSFTDNVDDIAEAHRTVVTNFDGNAVTSTAVSTAAEDHVMLDVKAEEVKQKVQVKDEVGIKREEDMEVD